MEGNYLDEQLGKPWRLSYLELIECIRKHFEDDVNIAICKMIFRYGFFNEETENLENIQGKKVIVLVKVPSSIVDILKEKEDMEDVELEYRNKKIKLANVEIKESDQVSAPKNLVVLEVTGEIL